jgi:hypothetical protein
MPVPNPIAGNFNSANFNSANLRTDAATLNPDGNFHIPNFTYNFFLDGAFLTDTETGIGIDIGAISFDATILDGYTLPHVVQMQVQDHETMIERPVLFQLSQWIPVSRIGRAITLQGWTDQLSDVQQLEILQQQTNHTLVLPYGDGVQGFAKIETTATPNEYGVYKYTVTFVEVIT